MTYSFEIANKTNDSFQQLCVKFDNGVQGIVTEELLSELRKWMGHIPKNLIPDGWKLVFNRCVKSRLYGLLEQQLKEVNGLFYFQNGSIIDSILELASEFPFCFFQTINWIDHPVSFDMKNQKAVIVVQTNSWETYKLVIVQSCSRFAMTLDMFDVQLLYWNSSNKQHIEIRPLDKYYYSSLCDEPHSFHDFPAVVIGNSFHWYKHGLLHRDGEQVSSIVIKESNNTTNFSFSFHKNGKLFRDFGKPSEILFCNRFCPTNKMTTKTVHYKFYYWGYTGYRFPLFQYLYPQCGFVRVNSFAGKRFFVAPNAEIQDVMECITNDIIQLGLIVRPLFVAESSQTILNFVSRILHFIYLGCPNELLEQLIFLVFTSFPPMSISLSQKMKRKKMHTESICISNKRFCSVESMES